jgi:signal transduction histidine kinase/DNA-binding response OmpR family regulator
MKKLNALYGFLLKCLWLVVLISQSFAAMAQLDRAELKKLRGTHDLDSGKVLAQQLIAQARSTDDKKYEAQIFYTWSFQAYAAGDELKALELARQGKNIASPKDSLTYVKLHTIVAYMLSRRGRDVEALKEAFDILIKADSYGWKTLSIDCRICIADLYRTIKQSKKALLYALQAQRDAKAIKDTSQYIYALSTLSNIYSNRDISSPENLKKATLYMEVIIHEPYYSKLSPYEQARYLSNTGRLYQMQKRYTDAESVLLRAMEIDDKNGFKGLKKNALNEYLTAKLGQKKYAEAAAYGEQALAMLPAEQSSRLQQMNIYDRLVEAYIGLNNYKKAYYYSEQAHAIDDSLLAASKAKDAAELDKQYQADKRLLQADSSNSFLKQQRNFIIIIAVILLIAIIAAYRWLAYKRTKEAALLAEEHKQLARLDAMKTRFFANISHELRTPLTLIMGPVNQMMSDEHIAPELQRSYLQTVWRNSKKLLAMVNELLDLGKIETGHMPVKLQDVQLKQFLSVLYQSFASAAEHKKIKYVLLEAIDRSTTVRLDKEQFEKIANNLISNAIKFTPAGQAITVMAEVNNGIFKFSVTDTGIGIRPEDLPHVFERYYQGNKDGVQAEGGTGIGLAITKESATLLGGNVYVQSLWGQGATFVVELPVEEVVETHEEIALQSATSQELALTDRKLVMLVEDHVEMSEHIASILSELYEVVKVADGNEALTTLNNLSRLPDLIISDVMMPGMDGFDLLNNLKRSEIFCRIPVIMLTALSDTANKLHALHIGVDDYVSKPFNSKELLSRAANLIHNASERSRATADELTEISKSESSAINNEGFTNTANLSPADLAWLDEVEALVRKFTGRTDLNISILSYELAISERQLFRRIKNITGLTPNKYIRTIRLQIAREAIESGNYRTIAEISYAAGFETPAYFSKLYKEHYGRDISDLL